VDPRQSRPEQQSVSAAQVSLAAAHQAQKASPGVPPVQPRSVQHSALPVHGPPKP
jgi:hypothetical protein